MTNCTECGSSEIYEDYIAGESVCTVCGTVLNQLVNISNEELRTFTMEDWKRKRTSPLDNRMHDRGLSTTIPFTQRDGAGRVMSREQQAQAFRMRRLNNRTKTTGSRDRNLAIALSLFSKAKGSLTLTGYVQQVTVNFYRTVLQKQLTRGRTIVSVIAACTYAACRMEGNSVRLDDISAAYHNPVKDIARCYRLIHRELSMKPKLAKIKPHLAKLLVHFNMTGEAELEAIELMDRCVKDKVATGKDPRSMAVAITYIIAVRYGFTAQDGGRITQKIIAKAGAVTEVTLRNRYKELKDKYNIEMKVRRGSYRV